MLSRRLVLACALLPAAIMVGCSGKKKEWYEGGTLHKKSALDWQVATYEDKLATCADIVSYIWKNGGLAPHIQNSIKNVDDIKVYAQELVACIDKATTKDADPDRNYKMYANQDVAGMSVLCMALMKWMK